MSNFDVCISIKEFQDFLNIKDKFLKIYGHREQKNLVIIEFFANIFAELENKRILCSLLLYPYVFEPSRCSGVDDNCCVFRIYYLPSNSEVNRNIIYCGMIITKYRMDYEDNEDNEYIPYIPYTVYNRPNKPKKIVKPKLNKDSKIVSVESQRFNADKYIQNSLYYKIIPNDKHHIHVNDTSTRLVNEYNIPIYNIYPHILNKLNNILNSSFLILVIYMNRLRYKNKVHLPPELIQYIRMEFCALQKDIYDE